MQPFKQKKNARHSALYTAFKLLAIDCTRSVSFNLMNSKLDSCCFIIALLTHRNTFNEHKMKYPTSYGMLGLGTVHTYSGIKLQPTPYYAIGGSGGEARLR